MTDKELKNTRKKKHKGQKKKNRKKLYMFIFIPAFLILLGTVSYGVVVYTKAQKAVDDSYKDVGRENETSDLRVDTVDPVEDNVSILIIGVDDSEKREYDENSRSDTLILATFNKEKGNVKLLSIPRDSYVYVPEVGYSTKINSAHFYGGPKASIETVENFLNVPVDYYVRLNFEAFIEVVDSLGGIDYNVPFKIDELNSKDKINGIHLEPGYQKLDGEEALALARTRKYDNDFERGKRQQEIIKTIVKETVSASSIMKMGNLIDAVGNNMTTNLSFDEMKSFMGYGLNNDFTFSSLTLEGSGGYMDDGLWYFQVDENSRIEVEMKLREQLDMPISESANANNTKNYDKKTSNS